MNGKKLRTGILGLKDEGEGLPEVIAGSEHFELVAVADKDSELVEKTSKMYDCSGYDDYRQFVIANELDCLIVTAGLYSCGQHVKAGMKKKFNVLKLAPAGRNFEEALEFVRLARLENVQFAVATPGRFSRSFGKLQRLLEEGKIEQVYLICAEARYGREHRPAWHNDPELAGGGVLLRECYELIDNLVWTFGCPEQVYSVNTNLAVDRQQRQRLTEDTAIVIMRFADNLCANLVAQRYKGPDEQSEVLRVYGRDSIVMVTEKGVSIADRLGKVVKRRRRGDEPSGMAAVLENFALSIIEPQENPCRCAAEDNLATMAVVEAAYLSARTAVPEEPARILEVVESEPRKLWPGPQ